MSTEGQTGQATGTDAHYAAMAAAHRARTHPQLARGIVWSDLVREMDEEWAEKQRSRGGSVVPLPPVPEQEQHDGDALGEAA